MKIAWVIPCPTQGSGGLRTILQNANTLRSNGHECRLFIYPNITIDIDGIRDEIINWYGYDFGKIEMVNNITDDYDAIFATFWQTAQVVSIQPIKYQLYLCQDYEPWFYPMGDNYLEAESTYRLGLTHICLGKWLCNRIQRSSHSISLFYNFGADTKSYFPKETVKEHAVCAIFQPDKPRRLTRLLVETITSLNLVDPELKIYLYGSTGYDHLLKNLNCTNLGILSIEECNDLYNRCKIGISLSCTNPSRIPFEMMSAGLPVIEINRESNVEDLPESAVRFSECDASSLANCVMNLLQSPDTLNSMSSNGIEFMEDRTLADEESAFVNCFTAATSDPDSNKLEQDTGTAESIRSSTSDVALKNNIDRMCHERMCFRTRQIKLTVSGISETATGLSAFVWSDPDQKDMTTLNIPLNRQETAVGFIDIPKSEIATIFHIHLYEFADEAPKLICGFDQAFITVDNKSLGRYREISENDYMIRIEAT